MSPGTALACPRSLRSALAAALLLLAAPAARAEDKVVEIKLGTLAPKGSPWDLQIRELSQKWQEASRGTVRLRVYPGGVLGSETDMIRKMRNNTIQAAALTAVGLHDITPEPQVIDVPMMIDSYEELDYVMSRVQGDLEKSITDKGYVVLAWSEVGFVNFFSARSFHTVAQAREAKIFAWEGDPAAVEAWKVGGFHPVVLASTDIVPSLQTGLIDTVATAPLYALTARLYNKANHMLDLRWAVLVGATVVRKDVWEQVPADVRPRLIELSRAYGRRIALDVRKQNDEAIATMKGQGLVVEKAEDLAGWTEAANRANEVVRGKVVPAAVFDLVTRHRNEYRAAHKKN